MIAIMEFVTPAMYMPFSETGRNAALDRGGAEMWEWINSFGLAPDDEVRNHIERTRPELMAARYFPTADPGLLGLLAEYVAWGFMVDDEFDEGAIGRDPERCRQVVGSLVSVFEKGAPKRSSPLELALADLWARTSVGRSAGWCQQFVADVNQWLQTYVTEALDRVEGRIQAPHLFWEHRQLAIGMRMFMDLGEIVALVDLPHQARYCKALLDMRRASAEQISIVNDLFSVKKDLAHGYLHNHVLVLCTTSGCTIQEGIDTVTGQATACLERFLVGSRSLVDELHKAGVDDDVRGGAARCGDGLQALIRGNYDWHFEVSRYSDADEVSKTPGYVPDFFARRGTSDRRHLTHGG